MSFSFILLEDLMKIFYKLCAFFLVFIFNLGINLGALTLNGIKNKSKNFIIFWTDESFFCRERDKSLAKGTFGLNPDETLLFKKKMDSSFVFGVDSKILSLELERNILKRDGGFPQIVKTFIVLNEQIGESKSFLGRLETIMDNIFIVISNKGKVYIEFTLLV
jgi:hypothetical protein